MNDQKTANQRRLDRGRIRRSNVPALTKFAAQWTKTDPPASRRRKVEPEQKHTPQEWECLRQRIEELYIGEDLGLPKVKDILRKEGFAASEKQLRDRIHLWGMTKYLKLSEQQWRFILYKCVARLIEAPNKSTAFRYKGSGQALQKDKLQRNLRRRFPESIICDVASIAGTLSSYGLSAYTSSVCGFRLNMVVLKEGKILLPFPKIDDEKPPVVLKDGPPPGVGSFAIRAELLSGIASFTIRAARTSNTPGSDIAAVASNNADIINRLQFPGPYTGLNSASYIAKTNLASKFVRRLSQTYRDISLTIAEPTSAGCTTSQSSSTALGISCDNCPGYLLVFDTSVGPGLPWDIFWKFENFENYHLQDESHRKKMNIRLLNPKQSTEREKFINKTGATCGHDQLPANLCNEGEPCWSPGGCRWSQLLSLEEEEMLGGLQVRQDPVTRENECGDLEGLEAGTEFISAAVDEMDILREVEVSMNSMIEKIQNNLEGKAFHDVMESGIETGSLADISDISSEVEGNGVENENIPENRNVTASSEIINKEGTTVPWSRYSVNYEEVKKWSESIGPCEAINPCVTPDEPTHEFINSNYNYVWPLDVDDIVPTHSPRKSQVDASEWRCFETWVGLVGRDPELEESAIDLIHPLNLPIEVTNRRNWPDLSQIFREHLIPDLERLDDDDDDDPADGWLSIFN